MRRNWGPRPIWNDLENVRQHVGKIISEAMESGREDITCTDFPIMDIYQKDGELLVYAELPGLEQSDVNLELEDNVLTISGRIKRDDENLRPIRTERYEGEFKRSVRASYTVDIEKVKAEIKNGVLMVYLPKHAAAKPKTINIEIH